MADMMMVGTMGKGTNAAGAGGGNSHDPNIMGPPSAGAGTGGAFPSSGRMTHSLSTPSGVDGSQSTPRHRGGKKLTVRVQMLDDSITMFQVQVNTKTEEGEGGQ